jgi:hypothetical protein
MVVSSGVVAPVERLEENNVIRKIYFLGWMFGSFGCCSTPPPLSPQNRDALMGLPSNCSEHPLKASDKKPEHEETAPYQRAK